VLLAYLAFLVLAIVTIVPTSLALQALLRPLMSGRLTKIRQRFEQPSGSSTERSHLHED